MKRAILIGGLAVLAAAALVAGLMWGGTTGDSGAYAITIDGPDGMIWNGSVDVEDATALGALLAASDGGNFDVRYTGSGETAFVMSIDGHENAGSGGWCYAVWTNGAWTHPIVSAGAWPLAEGDAVWWHYELDGCPAG